MINLAGKTAVVFGLANKRSIAWGIAQKLHEAGATLAICYQNERMKAEAEGSDRRAARRQRLPVRCLHRRGDRRALRRAQGEVRRRSTSWCTPWPLRPPTNCAASLSTPAARASASRMDVSVYSLIAVSRAAVPLMTEGGSIMTMSYYAAEKVVPNYNVMAIAKSGLECSVRYLAWSLGSKNIRVNAISAGPIKTLAARGVGDLTEMMRAHAARAPLGRNVDQIEVGGTALYLASDLASAVTGETIYVDCGYNVMGF